MIINEACFVTMVFASTKDKHHMQFPVRQDILQKEILNLWYCGVT